MIVTLREVRETDLPLFYENQRDEESVVMAAVPPRGEEAFYSHWRGSVLGDPAVVKRTVVADGRVAGFVLGFDRDGKREIGYWIDRRFWGQGVASRAVAAFLAVDPARPLYGVVARHNAASRRVLEKCGFVLDDGDEESLTFVLR